MDSKIKLLNSKLYKIVNNEKIIDIKASPYPLEYINRDSSFNDYEPQQIELIEEYKAETKNALNKRLIELKIINGLSVNRKTLSNIVYYNKHKKAIVCPCGVSYCKFSQKRHENTKKHLLYMASNNP